MWYTYYGGCMSNNININMFPNEMIFDKNLTIEQLNLLENQYRKFLALSKEKMDINQYQLYLNRNKKAYFPRGTLIYCTSSSLDNIKTISKRGILASEFLGIQEDGYTFYCADFSRVSNDTLVYMYDREFTSEGKTPFNKSNNTIGFIINPSSKLGGLLYYDLLDSKFDNNPDVRNIIDSSFLSKNYLVRNRAVRSAILCGIPANAISGIVLGDKLIQDDIFIREIQNLFPNCYIITRKGNIIKDRTNTIDIDDYEKLALMSARRELEIEILERDLSKIKDENKKRQEELIKYMEAVKTIVPPLLQAKILLKIGYQGIPQRLLELLTEEELKELRIKEKKTKK